MTGSDSESALTHGREPKVNLRLEALRGQSNIEIAPLNDYVNVPNIRGPHLGLLVVVTDMTIQFITIYFNCITLDMSKLLQYF